MIGGEMTKNDDFTLSLLTNGEVLRIQKESFCAHPLWTSDSESVWVAPRKDGQGLYAALFNLSDKARRVRVTSAQLEYTAKSAAELWTGAASRPAKGLNARLAAHDAAVFLLK